MRKFSKLTLVIVTAVSLVCFLFYKIQYDKLYNVLQVLEFFGTADQSAQTKQVLDHRILTGLLPTWQYVSPSLFIYSAFCSMGSAEGGSCIKVTALAAATESAATSSEIGCQLWYEGTVRPVMGIFASSGLLHESGHGTDQLKPYVFTCESKFPTMVPFGISVTIGRMDGFVHVTTTSSKPVSGKKSKSGPESRKDIVACIGPQQTHEDSTELLTEQVLLQDFYQIRDFVVYDAGLTNRFVSTVSAKQQETDHGSMEVVVLPWNSPPGLDRAASRVLAKMDCHYRTKPLYRSSLFLNLGQMLVIRSPKENFLENLLKRLAEAPSGGSGGGAKLDVGVRHFCADAPLDAPSSAVEYAIDALRKSRYDASLDKDSVSLMYNVTPDSDVIKVSEEDLLVHDYGPCETYDIDDTSKEKVDDFLVNHAKLIQTKLGKYFSKID